MITRWLVITGVLIGAQTAWSQEAGQELFQQRCAACHSIGGGTLVGPDLAHVTHRRSEAWLLKFIKSPQTAIQSGDATATALFEEFNKMVMPDQLLTDEQIRAVLTYITETGDGAGTSSDAAPATIPVTTATPEDVAQGQAHFQGHRRFANGGPSCISCHNNDAVLGGGALAKDLTMVHSRLGEPGIRAILTNPPFPVMQAAYAGRPLADDEIRVLIGFLQHADKENTLRQPREYGWAMFGAGLAGVSLLLVCYSLMRRGRKKRSVNQDIYDRQDKSE